MRPKQVNYITIIIGILAFAVVRPVFVEVAGLFGTLGAGLSGMPQQAVIGLISGCLAMPIAVLFFQKKWARIAACALAGSAYGVSVMVVVGLSNKLPTNMLVGTAVLVFITWVICGFLSGWITMAIVEIVQTRSSKHLA